MSTRWRPSPAFLTALAVCLALLHAILAVTATGEKCMTSDEIAHLDAGHAYNTLGDFRLQPENGNLSQRLAALPMKLGGVPPLTATESWRTADVWVHGREFFYQRGLSTDEWLWLGRATIALLSAATGLLVFFWSRALFGWRGAFLSLALFAFCPAFLAHGALATSDVAMTFFFTASVGAWWRHLTRPGPGGMALSAATLGLAFVAKYSAVLLPPMLALIGLIWAAGESRRTGWRAVARRLAGTTLVHALATWAIVWAFYGFRFSAFAPDLAEGANFNVTWEWLLPGLGAPAPVIVALRDWHVLPEAWLYGLVHVLQFAKARGAFLAGDYSVTGWVAFFPYAFAVKTTVPLLLLLAGAAVAGGLAAARKKSAALLPVVPLAVLFIGYWATSLASTLNIGHRHILPTYPALFIAAGWLGRRLDRRTPLAGAAIAGLALWHATEAVRVRPHYLAYFNQIAGGPENGWRHLVDSSLDWGQDLPGLKRWLYAHARGERVFLSYIGSGSPAYEGIAATLLPILPDLGPPRRWHALEPGVYAIGATMLQHVYSKVRGPWTLENEKDYQMLRATEPDLLAFQANPARRAELLRVVPVEKWTAAWKQFEQLRFARLCHYLRARPADAAVGHSIRIYRLSADELRRATAGDLREWSALIEETAAPGR
jgi:hypothetical protein